MHKNLVLSEKKTLVFFTVGGEIVKMSEVTRIQVGQTPEEARISSPQSSTTDSAIG